jgi:hypothetical protein
MKAASPARWSALLLPLVILAACTASPSAAPSQAKVAGGPARSSTTTTSTVPPTTTTTEQPGWTPSSAVGAAIAVDSRSVPMPDGSSVALFRFRAPVVRFALHVGSTDPPVAATQVGPDSGAAIGPHEAPVLLAAFNGGFKTNSGTGGFELDSQVLVPLQAGAASLVIDTNGSAHVGVWGQGLPLPGEQVWSVRQNLQPLVSGGQPSPSIGAIGAWGATLGGGAAVARSALGEDAAGNLIYAGSMHAVPSDLALALTSVGVLSAMELDINPEWVQLAVAAAPGGPLVVGVPGQGRPANQYQAGWTRDFVTVLAAQ